MTTLYSISTFKSSRKITRPFADGDSLTPEEQQANIDAAVEKAVAPLRDNRDAILEEKKKTAEALTKANGILSQLGGEDGIKSLIELKKKGDGDETLQRIQKGEWQEVFQEKTLELRQNYEGQLKEAAKETESVRSSEQAAIQKFKDKMREVEVMSVTATSDGFQSAAISDVQARSAGVFNYFNEDTGAHEIRDKDNVTKLGKDGVSPYSVTEWLEAQKETCSHWWVPSKGTNAPGSTGGPGAATDMSKLSFAEFEKTRKEQNGANVKLY